MLYALQKRRCMKKTDFVIPYIVPADGGEELKHVLRSIEKNYEGEAVIWLIGERPDWINEEKVNCIPVERINGMDYMVYMDTLQKIRTAAMIKEIGANFVYMYDDTYFINKVKFEDIAELKALENMAEIPRAKWFLTSTASNKWKKLMLKTFERLEAEGLPVNNYETHCPRVYNKRKALKVMDDFDMQNEIFMFATLYYNVTEKNANPRRLMPWGDGVKLGVYKQFTYEQLAGKVKENKFLNYDVASYNEGIRQLIGEMFAEKSKYEL